MSTLADRLRAQDETKRAETAALLREAADALTWREIETLGFGIEEPVLVVTDGGFAWVVDCDKDMNGAWIKECSALAENVEHIGVVTHWRFLGDLPHCIQNAQRTQDSGEVGT